MRQISPSARGLVLSAGVLFLLTLAAGCSGSKGTITGKVTYQGQALTGGIVLFVSTAGNGTGRSTIGSDGSYTIENMPAGMAKIAIDTRSAQRPAAGSKGPPGNMMPPEGAKVPDAAKKSGVYGSRGRSGNAVAIPENYADPEKSGLEYMVTGGAQTHNIDLK
jgi:hypothetical protein